MRENQIQAEAGQGKEEYRHLTIKSSFSVVTMWRKIFLHQIGKITRGQLIIKDQGRVITVGDDPELSATICIRSPKFYQKVIFGGGVGAAEAHMDGMIEVDDLTLLVRIMLVNMELLQSLRGGSVNLIRLSRRIQHLLRKNNRRGSRENIQAHYDLSFDLFKSFLDPTMMYSSAIFPDNNSILEEAAVHKTDYICQKLQLGPADRVLEIGSGWGGFAIHAASKYGCQVTTVTVSEDQFKEAQKRVEEAGLAHRIAVLNRDYRDLVGKYDKLIAIEMIEAVGKNYLPGFFKKCSALLKPEGMMLLQAITIRDQQYKAYLSNVDFIQKYIFPGGCLVSNSVMFELLRTETDMVARGLEDFGFHYARTLREWRKRFLANFKDIQSETFDERFKRLWEYYLCYCEGGFKERAISVVQLLATKPENRSAV